MFRPSPGGVGIGRGRLGLWSDCVQDSCPLRKDHKCLTGPGQGHWLTLHRTQLRTAGGPGLFLPATFLLLSLASGSDTPLRTSVTSELSDSLGPSGEQDTEVAAWALSQPPRYESPPGARLARWGSVRALPLSERLPHLSRPTAPQAASAWVPPRSSRATHGFESITPERGWPVPSLPRRSSASCPLLSSQALAPHAILSSLPFPSGPFSILHPILFFPPLCLPAPHPVSAVSLIFCSS